MKLLVFAASHRPDSLNRKLAKLVQAHAEARGVAVTFCEYAQFDMPAYNDLMAQEGGFPESALALAGHLAEVDGLVICSPEYNWSYPGSLKNIIDWLSRLPAKPLSAKTAVVLSASPGQRGGVVGLQQLKATLEALRVFVYPRVMPLGNADKAFGEDGRLLDKSKTAFLLTLLDDYLTYTQKLTGATA